MLVNSNFQSYSKFGSQSLKHSNLKDKNFNIYSNIKNRASRPVVFLSLIHINVRNFNGSYNKNNSTLASVGSAYASAHKGIRFIHNSRINFASNPDKGYSSSSNSLIFNKNKYTHTSLSNNYKLNNYSKKRYNIQNPKSKKTELNYLRRSSDINETKWARKNNYISNAKYELFKKFRFFDNDNLKFKISNKYNLKLSESYLKLLKRFLTKFYAKGNNNNLENDKLFYNENKFARFYLNRGLRSIKHRTYSSLKFRLFKKYLFTRYYKYYVNLDLKDIDKSLDLLKAKEETYSNKDLVNLNKDELEFSSRFIRGKSLRKFKNFLNKENGSTNTNTQELKISRWINSRKLRSLKLIKSLVESKNFDGLANNLNLMEKPFYITENYIKETIGGFILNYLKKNKVVQNQFTVSYNRDNRYWNWNFKNYFKDININKFFYEELEYRSRFLLGFKYSPKNSKLNFNVNINDFNRDMFSKKSSSRSSSTANSNNILNKNKKLIKSASHLTTQSLKLESKKSNLIFIKKNRTNNVQINVKRLKTRLPIFISNYKDLLTKTEKGNIGLSIIYNLANEEIENNTNNSKLESLNNGSDYKTKINNLFDKEDRVNIVNEYEYRNYEPRGLTKDQYIFSKLKYNKTLLYSIKHIFLIRKKYFNREFRIWKAVLNYSRKKRFKKLILNSYIYKRSIINHFSSMSYLNRTLLAVKIAQNLNSNLKEQKRINSGTGTGTVVKKIELNSRIFYKKIYEILNVNLNELNIFEMNNNNIAFRTGVLKSQKENNKISNKTSIFKSNLDKNILGYQYQNNHIVNNLLLQKLIISNYKLKDLRHKLLRYRLSFILDNRSAEASNNKIKNNLKLRKAIVNLYKGSVNKNGFKVLSGSGKYAQVKYRNNNFDKSHVSPVLFYNNTKIENSELNKSPNIRNLRIILQRLIISKFKFKKGFNNGLNLKLLLPTYPRNSNPNQSLALNNNINVQKRKQSSIKTNIIYNGKKNNISTSTTSTNSTKSSNNLLNLNKWFDFKIKNNKIDTYKDIFNWIAISKEYNNIKKNSKNLLFNPFFRFRRLRHKRLNLNLKKLTTKGVYGSTSTKKFNKHNFSKYLPIVENFEYLISKFSNNYKNSNNITLTQNEKNFFKLLCNLFIINQFNGTHNIMSKAIKAYSELRNKDLQLKKNINKTNNSYNTIKTRAVNTLMSKNNNRRKRNKVWKNLVSKHEDVKIKINNNNHENFIIFKYWLEFLNKFSNSSSRKSRTTSTRTSAFCTAFCTTATRKNDNNFRRYGNIRRSNSFFKNRFRNKIYNINLTNKLENNNNSSNNRSMHFARRFRNNFINYMLENYMLNLVRYQNDNDFTIKNNLKDSNIDPMDFISNYWKERIINFKEADSSYLKKSNKTINSIALEDNNSVSGVNTVHTQEIDQINNNQILLETNFVKTHLRKKMPFLTLSNRLTNTLSNFQFKKLTPIKYLQLNKINFINRRQRRYSRRKNLKFQSSEEVNFDLKQTLFMNKYLEKKQQNLTVFKNLQKKMRIRKNNLIIKKNLNKISKKTNNKIKNNLNLTQVHSATRRTNIKNKLLNNKNSSKLSFYGINNNKVDNNKVIINNNDTNKYLGNNKVENLGKVLTNSRNKIISNKKIKTLSTSKLNKDKSKVKRKAKASRLAHRKSKKDAKAMAIELAKTGIKKKSKWRGQKKKIDLNSPAYSEDIWNFDSDVERVNENSILPFYLYNNNYKIIEKNITNYKFKTAPLTMDLKKNTFNRMNFSIYLYNIYNNPIFNENDGLNNTWLTYKNTTNNFNKKYFRNNLSASVRTYKKNNLNKNIFNNTFKSNLNNNFNNKYLPSLNHNYLDGNNNGQFNNSLLSVNNGNKQAIINYWLLEQDKQNKRSFMNPHLSMLINNRASSYQHRINFLKVNQLGFLHSKGFLRKNTIINTFLDKLIQFNKYNKYKHYKTLVKVNNITEFIKTYNLKHKKSYVKKHLSDDIIKFKTFNVRNFYIALFLSIGDFDKYLNYINMGELNVLASASVPTTHKFNIFLYNYPQIFVKNGKKNFMRRFIKIYFNKLSILNKLNKFRKKLFEGLKLNILKRKIKAKEKINSIIKFKSRKYGKAKAKINNRFSFLFIYLFLIDKKTALTNLKIHFRIENLLKKNLIKGVQQGLIRTYGKKTLKALGIKNLKRKKYNKLLVFIEKNFIAHTSNSVLKYLLILKWKRQANFKNYELLNWNSDYFYSKNLLKNKIIKNNYKNNKNLIIKNSNNNKISKPTSLFNLLKLKKKKIRNSYHGTHILYTSVFKKIKSNRDRNKNRLINKKKNKNREAVKIKKEKAKQKALSLLENSNSKYNKESYINISHNNHLKLNNKFNKSLNSIRYTKAFNSFDPNFNSNNFIFNSALAYLGKYYPMNYYTNSYIQNKLTASRYKKENLNIFKGELYNYSFDSNISATTNKNNITNLSVDLDNKLIYDTVKNKVRYINYNTFNTLDKNFNKKIKGFNNLFIQKNNDLHINYSSVQDFFYSWNLKKNKINNKLFYLNNSNKNNFRFNLDINVNNNHLPEFNSKFGFIVPSRNTNIRENILKKGNFFKGPVVSLNNIINTELATSAAYTSSGNNQNKFKYSYNNVPMFNTYAYGANENKNVENLELSGSLSPFFDFLVDNKNLNKKNKIGLRKILSEFKFFRYFKKCGSDINTYQIISYSFTKNISRANTLNSLDHTGSLLKVSISVILKYFFKLMGSSLISKPFFIFSPNNVTIQISYLISNKLFLSNNNIKNWNEIVSTLSAGMQFYWPISWKQYRNIIKKDMPESGSWPSYWRMKYYYLKRKPFNEKVEPIFPGNMPYLSQMIYDEYVFRKIRHANKLSGRFWNHEEKKYVKRKIVDANISKVLYTIPYVKNILSFFYKELSILTYLLEKFFNCSIKLELSRLKSPYSDTNIMAQLVGINGEENNFEKIKTKFFDYYTYCNPNSSENRKRFYINSKPFKVNSIKSPISQLGGYKYRVAGRFYKHRIIPRKTVSSIQRGSMARGIVNVVDKARYINKSKRGSFSVTVWISHIF